MKTLPEQSLIFDKVRDKVYTICKKKKIMPHYVNTSWHNFSYLQNGYEHIAFGDVNGAIWPITNGLSDNVLFWADNPIALGIAGGFGIKTFSDKNKIISDMDKTKKRVIRTNVAFSIYSEMILDIYPKIDADETQSILPSESVLSFPNASGSKHDIGCKVLSALKNMGLKRIIHFPNRYFERLDTKNGEIDAAQVASVYVETEKGFDGDILVECLITGTKYYAPRNSIVFPRSEFSWKLSNIQSKIPLDRKGGLTQKLTPELEAKFKKQYVVEFSHYCGRKGFSQRDSVTDVVSSLPYGNLIMPGGNFSHDFLLYGFNTLLEAQSFQSLAKVPEFVRAYIDCSFKIDRHSGPTMEFVSVFPLDRIWNSQQVVDYVSNYYK